jgi:hypothetical protein
MQVELKSTELQAISECMSYVLGRRASMTSEVDRGLTTLRAKVETARHDAILQ